MQIGGEEEDGQSMASLVVSADVRTTPVKYAKLAGQEKQAQTNKNSQRSGNGEEADDQYSGVDQEGEEGDELEDGLVAVANPLLDNKKDSSTSVSSCFGRRHRQPFFGKFRFCIALLLAFATYSYTSMRMNLSMAMASGTIISSAIVPFPVCMVNSTAVHINENAVGHSQKNSTAILNELIEQEQCPNQVATNVGLSRSMGYQGILEWSAAQQARLFGATFYGSFFTVWVSGYLSDRFGTKLLIALAIADYSLVSLLTPWFVSIHYNVFFAARIFMGFGEGFVTPTLASASARWFPPAERSFMVAVCTLGNQIAALSALLLSSRLCALDILGGWPTIFYTFGLMGALCLALWAIFASNGPDESRWIGESEAKMIAASLGQKRHFERVKGPIPWCQMLLSMPLYAGILGQAIYTFCNVILQSYLPTFFKEVVQLNLKDNGFFSVIPFVAMICSKIGFGILADQLRKRHILSGTNTVKLFQCISNFGAALAAICMGLFVSCRTPGLAAIFMVLWGISYGSSTSGFFTQLICIGPRFTGTIISFSTAMGILSSGISPMVVSAIVRHGTAGEWRLIWYLLAACNLFCAFFFLIFASAKVQKWAQDGEQTGRISKSNGIIK